MIVPNENGLRERLSEQAYHVRLGIACRADVTTAAEHLVEAAIEAADAITSLIAERDGLREALKPFADEAKARDWMALGPDIDHWPIGGSALTNGDLRRARTALLNTKENGE